MDKLDLIGTILLLAYVAFAFFAYDRRVLQIIWWIRKNEPDLYEKAARGTSHISQLVIRNIKREKAISAKLPEHLYASFRKSERQVVVILIFAIAAVLLIAARRVFTLFCR